MLVIYEIDCKATRSTHKWPANFPVTRNTCVFPCSTILITFDPPTDPANDLASRGPSAPPDQALVPPSKEEVTSYEFKPGRKHVTRGYECLEVSSKRPLFRDAHMVPSFVWVRVNSNVGTDEENIVD
jgi:hypothetical protein